MLFVAGGGVRVGIREPHHVPPADGGRPGVTSTKGQRHRPLSLPAARACPPVLQRPLGATRLPSGHQRTLSRQVMACSFHAHWQAAQNGPVCL